VTHHRLAFLHHHTGGGAVEEWDGLGIRAQEAAREEPVVVGERQGRQAPLSAQEVEILGDLGAEGVGGLQGDQLDQVGAARGLEDVLDLVGLALVGGV
jgi:hypothetical protein